MKKFLIGVAIGLILLAITFPAFGQIIGPSIELGKQMTMRALLCLDRESATTLAKADSVGGVQGAIIALKTLDQCGVAVVTVKPTQVLDSFPTARGATVSVVEALVEMVDDSFKTVYILVDVPVKGVFKT